MRLFTRRVAAARAALLLPLLAAALVPSQTRGADDDTGKVVRRGKAATALLELDRGRWATAFCVDPAGLFVTNEHAVHGAAADARVTLILNPGETDQKVVQASVARVDVEADLALLKADPGEYPTLELGDTTNLVETAPVTAFGYPFGRLLGEKDGYPSITVSTGRITSLRKNKGQLTQIQLDNSLNPGNSGGPVLDAGGRVIGIVRAGIRASGVNFAIPVSHLKQVLDKPLIQFAPTTVPAGQSHQRRDFVVNVTSFREAKDGLKVELVLDTGKPGGRRTFHAAAGEKGAYMVSAEPVPEAAGPGTIRVSAAFSGGSVACTVDDRDVVVGGKTVRLSTVHRIERTAGPDSRPADATAKDGSTPAPPTTAPADAVKVILDGEVLHGQPQGLEEVEARFGPTSAKLDLSKADRVTFDPVDDSVSQVEYRVIVRGPGGKTMAEALGTIPIEGQRRAGGGATAGATARSSIEQPQLDGQAREVKLPGAVEAVGVGGGGRFLLLELRKLQELAVFDVSKAKVVKYIPLPVGEVRFAAGADKLFIGLKSQKEIQRWDLNTLERELTAPAPEGGIEKLAIGADAAGPLVVISEQQAKRSWLVDPVTLKAEHFPWKNWGGDGSAWGPVHVRVSFDGSTVVGCGGGWAGIEVVTLAGGQGVDNKAGGYVNGVTLVSGDGSLLFPEAKAVQRADLASNLTVPGLSGQVFPADDPSYFLALNDKDKKAELTVYSNSDQKPIARIRDLDELAAGSSLPAEQRVHLIPRAGVLVTVGQGGDKLILRRFSLTEALDALGTDYLFVESSPARTATAGKPYAYPIKVRSKKGHVRYALQSGPEGMTLSTEGVLAWNVPAALEAPDVPVIVSITDDSGQEVFHAFKILVSRNPEAGATVAPPPADKSPVDPSPGQ